MILARSSGWAIRSIPGHIWVLCTAPQLGQLISLLIQVDKIKPPCEELSGKRGEDGAASGYHIPKIEYSGLSRSDGALGFHKFHPHFAVFQWKHPGWGSSCTVPHLYLGIKGLRGLVKGNPVDVAS